MLLNGYSGIVTINVMNLEGKQLLQRKVQLTSLKFLQEQLDVSRLPSGIYIIAVIDEQGRKKTERLVVQH